MPTIADQHAPNLSRERAVSPPSRWRGLSVVAAFAIMVAALATALFCLRPAPPDGAAAALPAEALARGEEAYRKGDVAEAIAAWRKASEAGNAAAEKELGVAFKNGRGVAPDYGAALRFLRQAADQAYAPAMIELGEMYERGEGTRRDYAIAAKWYLEGWQRSGDKWAAYKLSLFYANGLGVAKDEAVANFWNALASSPAAMCG